jgi:hypothetical protein
VPDPRSRGGPSPRGHPTHSRPIARHPPRRGRHRPNGDAGLTVRIGDRLEVELDLDIALGVPVAEVARQVDSAVRYAIRRALGREIERFVIHVGGLRVQPAGSIPAVSGARPEAIRPHDLADSGTDVA